MPKVNLPMLLRLAWVTVAAGFVNLERSTFVKKSSMVRRATTQAAIEKQLRETFPEAKEVAFKGSSTVRVDGTELFYKVGTGGAPAPQALLQYEAEGLTRLADAAGDALAVPRPRLVGTCPHYSGASGFIVMDKLSFGGAQSRAAQQALGAGLAAVHNAPPPNDWPQQGVYGFPLDGCCGALAQPNNSARAPSSWAQFWAEHRLGFQLRQRPCASHPAIHALGAQLLPQLGPLFAPLENDLQLRQPSLLHGDLWSGNHAVTAGGKPSLFDPAAYYGHSEADFGIGRMFGGLSPDFYAAYFEVRPKKEEGFEQRALLYELHHYLNHYNIFGGSYASGAVDLMRRLLREL